MKSCFFISILVVLCGMVASLIREYAFYNLPLNWTIATGYCRYKRYKGLAFITTNVENERLRHVAENSNGWIGLHRNPRDRTVWGWDSDIANNFFSWKSLEPNDLNNVQNCVLSEGAGWNDCFCERELPFFCYRHIILVKENMTWAEAYRYCISKYTGLASVNSATRLQLAEIEAMPTETDSLWTGLSFLDGMWFWAESNEELGTQISLPSCPVNGYRCVARNFKTATWEFRTCEEKFNFLCY